MHLQTVSDAPKQNGLGRFCNAECEGSLSPRWRNAPTAAGREGQVAEATNAHTLPNTSNSLVGHTHTQTNAHTLPNTNTNTNTLPNSLVAAYTGPIIHQDGYRPTSVALGIVLQIVTQEDFLT